ncbi:MAG: hypothetical protein FWD78_10700 [Treponema sp.]|nr:hypothetical protein [Treponema sp.]
MQSKKTGFIVTAGHLDIEWYQPLRSYRFWTIEALDDLVQIGRTRSDFKTYVLDGQVYPLEEYLEVKPQNGSLMADYVKKGLLAVGPFYTQFDEWIPGAEAIIRNCLYGDRKAKKYGKKMMAGYLPDNFGHPLQMPQILLDFGLDSILFMRGMPETGGDHPDEFIYRGIDGSEIFASHFRDGYGGAFDLFKPTDGLQPRSMPYYDKYISYEWHRELADHDDPQRIAESLIRNAGKLEKNYPSGVIPLIAGYDHLPPQINIGDSVKRANEIQDKFEFVMGSAEDYVRLARQRMKNPAVFDMELTGSRYRVILLGAQSARTYLKRQNFGCEAMLVRYAEPLDAIVSVLGFNIDRTLFDEAWKFMMMNAAHDSIHGSSTDEVHVEMEARYAAVRQIASGITHQALKFIGSRIKKWWTGDQRGIVVYAPAGSGFMQTAEVWLPCGGSDISITRKDGVPVATQIFPSREIQRNSRGEPRNKPFPEEPFRRVIFSDKFYQNSISEYIMVYGKNPVNTKLICGNDFLENEFLRIESRGAVINLYDKRLGKWFYNLNLLEDTAETGDAWDSSPAWTPTETICSTQGCFTCTLTEQGPVKAVLKVSGKLNVPAYLDDNEKRSAQRIDLGIVFEIALFDGVPRADIKLVLDNTARDHKVRLHVLTGLKTKTVRSQGHFAVIDRPTRRIEEEDTWAQPPSETMPCREWVAFESGDIGFAVAFKGIYDYGAEYDQTARQAGLYLTLVRGFGLMSRINMPMRRGSASRAILTPGAQCPGENIIEWSYIPYSVCGNDRAPFIDLANSFLYEPAAHLVRSRDRIDDIDCIEPVYEIQNKNLQFSSFKKCIDGDVYILRFYENQGVPVQAIIRVSPVFKKCILSNMNEQDLGELIIKDNNVLADIGAYKVLTLKLFM